MARNHLELVLIEPVREPHLLVHRYGEQGLEPLEHLGHEQLADDPAPRGSMASLFTACVMDTSIAHYL
jgi:hypothetical protein